MYVCSLVEDSPQGLADCTNPALGLEELLRQRATELKGKEESQVGDTEGLAKDPINSVK